MKALILFLLVLGLYMAIGSPYYFEFIYGLKPKVSGATVVLVTGTIFAGLVMLIAAFLYNQKESFFFQLTPDRPKCSKILSGRPIGFEFTSDQDRFCYCSQPVKNPQTWGYDGYLAHNVKQMCQVGGCILPGEKEYPQDPNSQKY